MPTVPRTLTAVSTAVTLATITKTRLSVRASTTSGKKTRADLVDELGVLKELIKELQEKESALELALRKRVGSTEGQMYTFTSFDVSGKKFMWEKAKKLLGKSYEACWQPNVYRSSKVTTKE